MAVKKMKPKAAKKKPTAKKPTPKAAKKSVKTSAKASAKKPARKPAAKPPAPAPAKPVWLHPPVVHWEIQAVDPGRQSAFFSDLFGWAIDANNPQNYGMVAAAGEGAIGGGIGGAMEGKPFVTVYVEVPDINAALAKAESLGATTIMPRTDIGMVILAQFRDLEGNVIGLIESSPS